MGKRVRCLLLAAVIALGAVSWPGARAAEGEPEAPDGMQIVSNDVPVDVGPPPEPESTQDVLDISGGGSDAFDTEFTGRIKLTLISAALPCQVDFAINPSEEIDLSFEDGARTQVTQITNPTVAQVINYSSVPIDVSVIAVGGEQFRPGADTKEWITSRDKPFTLVGALDEVGPPGTALLVLGYQGRRFESQEDFESCALVPTAAGETPEPIRVARVEAGPSSASALWVYGKIASDGDYGHYGFSVETTIRVEAAR